MERTAIDGEFDEDIKETVDLKCPVAKISDAGTARGRKIGALANFNRDAAHIARKGHGNDFGVPRSRGSAALAARDRGYGAGQDERLQAAGAGESLQVTNQVLFTWQDGRGSLGNGWLLINREDTALTGEFGYDPDTIGAGSWTFIRIE